MLSTHHNLGLRSRKRSGTYICSGVSDTCGLVLTFMGRVGSGSYIGCGVYETCGLVLTIFMGRVRGLGAGVCDLLDNGAHGSLWWLS